MFTKKRGEINVWGKGLLQGLGLTFRYLKEPKVTIQYPDEEYVLPNRFRGIQYLDPEKCIVCNQCARICPTNSITLSGKPNPDPEKKGRVLDTYEINFEICILCDLCTEVCPTEAIKMTNKFELASYSRDNLLKDKKWLENNNTNVREANH
ncbi:NADH-quinone oxidoreductase subunit I [Vulcanibacillus modesticaldus]|uniref:NADH-quinone oxidoreductase subunit I n=1 Tax=Vulcanibacillus modesticaldus TaxID=337097 RepID=A0A1D2YVX2_9BACI|nr:NADH-quinone oxidoreductase subunit NuoI [Vulcanibacillus modesticaldus]OEF99823.1 NADH-quinone oxidoreductase subunit I [Vulcanibacillus modesticaldus]